MIITFGHYIEKKKGGVIMFKIINKESKLSGKMILAGCCRVASNTSGWVPIGCGC